ncbi:MAG: hydrogenase/urease maturation nickel metallochaperone HypA [Patescibacteria group bacterium]
MHDLLLAKQILDQVLSYVRSHGLKSVTKIVIEIGKIEEHGEKISTSNLKFNLSSLARGSLAAGAKIIIKKSSKPNYLNIKEIEAKK